MLVGEWWSIFGREVTGKGGVMQDEDKTKCSVGMDQH